MTLMQKIDFVPKVLDEKSGSIFRYKGFQRKCQQIPQCYNATMS